MISRCHRRLHLAILVSASMTLSACAQLLDPGPVIEEPGPGERVLLEEIERDRALPNGPSDEVRSSLIPPLPGSETFAEEDEPRFDVSVSGTAAQQFFMSLVEGTPYNMIMDPDVAGSLSLHLKSVTIPQVMDAARAAYGYEYAYADGVFHVSAPKIQSRIFELDYLNLRRTGQSQTRVSSGQVSEQSDGGGGDYDSREPARQGSSGAISGSVISTDSEMDLWHEVYDALLAMVGGVEGHSVQLSPNSGVVVVRAMPPQLREVEEYLERVQESLQRQVILEAKIIEVTLDDGFRSGINWALLSLPGADDSVLGAQTGGGTSLGSAMLSEIAGNLGILDPGAGGLPPGTDTSAFGGVFSVAIEADEFSAFIELLETQGEVQVLSSPRVSTLNNQKAVIKVGSDEFFVTDVSTTTVTGAATTTNPDVTLTPFFSGIALDVTPQIDREGSITLHVHPSVSEVTDQTKTIAIGTDTLSLPLAFSTIRETDSVVRARSGQVVVIGGLMEDNMANRRASTPWISKIPLLGSLFEHNLEGALKKELVILMRPVSVTEGTWRRAMQESADRIQRMKQQQRLGGRP